MLKYIVADNKTEYIIDSEMIQHVISVIVNNDKYIPTFGNIVGTTDEPEFFNHIRIVYKNNNFLVIEHITLSSFYNQIFKK